MPAIRTSRLLNRGAAIAPMTSDATIDASANLTCEAAKTTTGATIATAIRWKSDSRARQSENQNGQQYCKACRRSAILPEHQRLVAVRRCRESECCRKAASPNDGCKRKIEDLAVSRGDRDRAPPHRQPGIPTKGRLASNPLADAPRSTRRIAGTSRAPGSRQLSEQPHSTVRRKGAGRLARRSKRQ